MRMPRAEDMVKCAKCGSDIPLSSAIIDKGTIFPDLMRREHETHELMICPDCYAEARKNVGTPEEDVSLDLFSES